jgi:rhamnose utilization protein RhaD (predicted bifunctional aldolase and dehydrogenase)|tara:strand:+ start:9107 stop:10147 length:1041 start_codon:yes stop_codon:yes gene_type:complete
MDYIKKTIDLHNHFGKNDNYVQGAGGNISIKEDDIIHIKKSGKHFRDIKDENDVISCNISKEDIRGVLEIYNKQNLENQYNALIEEKISGKDRPSIELSFHVFGDKYTLHLHPTIINIFTCTEQGQEIIKKLCEDNENMSYVDYCKPGIILTDKIMEERSMLNEITFLFNHGIIITGPSEESIKERYELIENRLKKEIIYEEYKQDNELLRKSLNPEYNFIINNDFLQQKVLEILKSGSKDDIHELPHLYPDSAIYNAGVALQSAHKSANYIGDVIVYGFLYDRYQWGINVSSEKEAIFKTELFINKMKIEYFAKLNGFTPSYLDEQSVDELVNWDAEKYRQELLK